MNISAPPFSNLLYLSSTPNIVFKSVFIAFGLIALVANIILAAIIVRGSLWRKNHIYAYYLALLFADSVESLGYIMISVSSIYTHSTRHGGFTRFSCSLVNFPFYYGSLMYTAALLSISIDRLVAVALPLFYRQNTDRFQSILLSMAFVTSTLLAMGGLAESSSSEPVAICGLGNGLGWIFARVFIFLLWAGSVTVSTLYAVSILSIKLYQRRRRGSMPEAQDATSSERRFRRSATLLVATEFFTATVGLSALVASMLGISRLAHPQLKVWVGHACHLFIQANTLLSPAVLVFQHKRLRRALKERLRPTDQSEVVQKP